MRMPMPDKTVGLGFLIVLIAISAAVAWYATSRDSSANQVTTSFASGKSSIVVTLDIDRASVVAYLARFRASPASMPVNLRGYLTWCELGRLDPLSEPPVGPS